MRYKRSLHRISEFLGNLSKDKDSVLVVYGVWSEMGVAPIQSRGRGVLLQFIYSPFCTFLQVAWGNGIDGVLQKTRVGLVGLQFLRHIDLPQHRDKITRPQF